MLGKEYVLPGSAHQVIQLCMACSPNFKTTTTGLFYPMQLIPFTKCSPIQELIIPSSNCLFHFAIVYPIQQMFIPLSKLHYPIVGSCLKTISRIARTYDIAVKNHMKYRNSGMVFLEKQIPYLSNRCLQNSKQALIYKVNRMRKRYKLKN